MKIFLYASLYFILVFCNVLTAYNSNDFRFQPHVSCDASHNWHQPAKSSIQLRCGGYKEIPGALRSTGGAVNSQKKSTQKQTAQTKPGELNGAQKSAVHVIITQRTSEVSSYYQANFDALYPTMFQSIQNFVLNSLVDTTSLNHNFTHQMMHHLVTTEQTHHGIIGRYQQHPWVQNKDLSTISQSEKIMVNYMLDCMVHAKNDTTVELAQAGVQSWMHSQGAQSHEEYEHHIKKCNNYYRSMQHKMPTQLVMQQAQRIQKSDIEDLSQHYASIIEKNCPSRILHSESVDPQYAELIEKRGTALTTSKEQLRTNNLVHHTYEMSCQAQGFLMANNMNYAAFNATSVTDFQHCLTQEILGIIESSVDSAQRNGYQSIIAQLAYYNCNLAISAQQLNQLSQIKQAAAVTDLSHFFALFGRSILDDELEAQAWKDVGIGMYDGTKKVLYKWHEFAKKLGHRDTRNQTVHDVARDCYQVGTFFYHILEQCNEFSPFAYLDDMTKDMQDATDRMFKNYDLDEGDFLNSSSRMAQRQERNLNSLHNGLSSAVDAGIAIMQSMLTKTCKENISNTTEFSLDAIIYGKITDALVAISKIGASQCFNSSRSLQQLSQEILDDAMSFATSNNGELVAIAGASGENISAALASVAQIITNTAGPVFKYAEQANILADKIEEITKPNKHEVEAFQKSIEPYLRADKLVDVERLKLIEGVEQIDNFKKYTNNFHPDELAKLKSEEILYLNLCDWLEPQARRINARIKESGGIKITEVRDGIKCITEIHEFDLFHSLLGEMKPEALANRTSGGHLFIAELRSATLDIGKIESFGNGFIDMEIKYAGKIGGKYKGNSYFPIGTTVEQSVAMIENAILNFKEIEFFADSANTAQQALRLTNINNQTFALRIENKIAKFYPYNVK